MFIGQYQNNMDAKKRLTFPAKFRSQLAGSVFVTKGLDGCISVYTPEKWQEVYDSLMELQYTKKDARTYVRQVVTNAAELEFDASGRINIPLHLCESAGLTKECSIVGVGEQIEIWDVEKWNEYNLANADKFEDAANELMDVDF